MISSDPAKAEPTLGGVVGGGECKENIIGIKI